MRTAPVGSAISREETQLTYVNRAALDVAGRPQALPKRTRGSRPDQLFEPSPPFFEERRVTAPERFVEEVRLEDAAARFVAPLALLREVFAADFAPPRLDERDADFVDLVLRDEDREADFAPDFREAAFFAVDFLAAGFFAVDFLAVDFLAADFLAPVRVDDFAADRFAAAFVPFFAAPLREDDFAADFLAPDFFAAVLEPVFRAPLAALLRVEALRLRGVFEVAAPLSPPVEEAASPFMSSMVFDRSSLIIDCLLNSGLPRANAHARPRQRHYNSAVPPADARPK